jgi:hypothetical protein
MSKVVLDKDWKKRSLIPILFLPQIF